MIDEKASDIKLIDGFRAPKETDIVKIYITGKDWNWSDINDYIFIEDKQEFEEITKGLIQTNPVN